jgi:hypothetical protein
MFHDSKNSFGRHAPGSGNRPGAGPNFTGCLLETLERRTLLSGGTVTLDANGILTIVGTDQTDHIDVYRDRTNGDYLSVGLYEPSSAPGPIRIADVRGIVIYGLGGDDLIYVWNDRFNQNDHVNPASLSEYGKLNIPVTMYGGAGDDDLGSESNADDLIIGGPGLDHGYTMDGHDRFAVDYLENYHDGGWRTDPNTGAAYWDWGGAFKWNGPEGQIYADPYQVPNRGGTYLGSNAPSFPSEKAPEDSAAPSPLVPDLDNVDPVAVHGDEKVGPPAPATMTVLVPSPLPASPFSTRPFSYGDDAGHKPWDDAAVS